MEKKSSSTLIVVILVLAVVMLFAGAGLLYVGLTAESEIVTPAEPVEPTVDVATIVAQTVAAISEGIAEATAIAVQPTALLPTDVPPTSGPPPTATAVNTAVPTDTPIPIPTNTPVPTNTATPVPFIPTNTPIPPTNTPAPPTEPPPPPGPQPGNHNGLVGTHFALQDWRTKLNPGGKIWYEWTVGNTSGGGVPYSTIGVMPRHDGQDKVQWYQNNWGGNNDVMPPEGLSWPSWMSIPEAGDYTLRLVVCFDGFQTCLDGGGTFHTLSQEISVSIR